MNLVAIGQGNGREIFLFDFDHGNIRGFIPAHDAGAEIPLVVGRANLDFIRARDDVIGGQNIAFRGDNDARTEALFPMGTFALASLIARTATEKLAEEGVIQQRIANDPFMNKPGGVDVDDTGSRLFDDRCVTVAQLGIAVYGGGVDLEIRVGLLPPGNVQMLKNRDGQQDTGHHRNKPNE